MKNLKIEVPEGYEIDKKNSTFENIVFKRVESKYPTSVEEIDRQYWLGDVGQVGKCVSIEEQTINHFSTKERGEELLAFIQLLELRDAWNKIDGYEVDWTDNNPVYMIENYENRVSTETWFGVGCNLYFSSPQTRDLFLETFRDLIEKAKNLI